MKPLDGLSPFLLLWGLIATLAMTSILEASRGLGFSRLSLPFLIGTFFTSRRGSAIILGFVLYTIGGWLFAFIYFLLFASVGIYTWWFGALAGLVHGLFLLTCALPLLPFVHPRMASEYHSASSLRQLEPPGFLALNYGYHTPLSTLAALVIYGAALGAFVEAERAAGLSCLGEQLSLADLTNQRPTRLLRMLQPKQRAQADRW